MVEINITKSSDSYYHNIKKTNNSKLIKHKPIEKELCFKDILAKEMAK